MLKACRGHECSISHRRDILRQRPICDFLHLPVVPGPIPDVRHRAGSRFLSHRPWSAELLGATQWLVDLVPLFACLSGAECLAVLDRACRAWRENSVAASLLLLRALFRCRPGAACPPAGGNAKPPGVRRRLRRYMELLCRDDDQKGSPLNNALVMLEASVMLFEAPSTRARILLAAPFSSAARRIAGLLYPADRALTLVATPP